MAHKMIYKKREQSDCIDILHNKKYHIKPGAKINYPKLLAREDEEFEIEKK